MDCILGGKMKYRYLAIISLVLLTAVVISACSPQLTTLTQRAANVLEAQLSVKGLTSEAERITDDFNDNYSGAPATTDPGLLAAYQSALEQVYTKVNPQVVNITVLVDHSSVSGIPEIPFDLPEIPGLPEGQGLPDGQDAPGSEGPFYGAGAGSGFVWDKQGHIVTNNHVVAGAEKIDVTFHDGLTLSADLVGADPDSDLAVLKVDMPAAQLFPVELADEDQIRVGQLAIAIGNPFGLEGTMTVGIVSALGRTLPASEGILVGPVYSIPEIIQTDAPINPGNSGGVLTNSDGQVTGVTTAIESPIRANAGIGFAIPVSIVKNVVPALIEEGHYEHSYLGISGLELTPDLAEAMHLKQGQRGALVAEVVPGSPADKAGLHGSDRLAEIYGREVNVGGDVIVAIDGQRVKDMDDLIAYLTTETIVGQEITLTVLRDGKEKRLEVTLEARPAPQVVEEPLRQERGGAWMGILARELTPEIAEAMQLPNEQQGILVIQVEADSPADGAGLLGGDQILDLDGEQIFIGGDVITEFDGDTITDMHQLRQLLENAEIGQEVKLTVLRSGELIEVTLTLAERLG
jgi:S1-C subfamily serine protease